MFKKFLASFLLIAAVFIVGAQDNTAEASWYAKVVNCEEYITLRVSPDYDARRILRIPLGTLILITDDYDDGEFVSTRYNGVYGYVLKRYLDDAEK
ncbi:MAG: SH3 domain-containing protein [Selenomonadaceae bacterium]|nr:SH3 domain-containing protein [Selenomonadaceae bacterium]